MEMESSEIILSIIFLLGFPYLILCFIAYGHTIKDDASTKLLALSPSWAINEDIYDDVGKKICVYGKKLFWINILLGAGWLISISN